MRVRLIITYTKLPQPVVNTKSCNFPLMLIVLLLLKVLTNAPVGVTVDNKILKSCVLFCFYLLRNLHVLYMSTAPAGFKRNLLQSDIKIFLSYSSRLDEKLSSVVT